MSPEDKTAERQNPVLPGIILGEKNPLLPAIDQSLVVLADGFISRKNLKQSAKSTDRRVRDVTVDARWIEQAILAAKTFQISIGSLDPPAR